MFDLDTDRFSKIGDQLESHEQIMAWRERLARLAEQLKTVPMGIFMGGDEFRVAAQLSGLEGESLRLHASHVLLVEERIAEYKRNNQ